MYDAGHLWFEHSTIHVSRFFFCETTPSLPQKGHGFNSSLKIPLPHPLTLRTLDNTFSAILSNLSTTPFHHLERRFDSTLSSIYGADMILPLSNAHALQGKRLLLAHPRYHALPHTAHPICHAQTLASIYLHQSVSFRHLVHLVWFW